MRDPLSLEREFRTLQHLLPLLGSPRMRLLRMMDFLAPLADDSSGFLHAYGMQLFPQFVAVVLRTDFTGTNISYLRRATDLLRLVKTRHPSLCEVEKLDRAVEHLEQEERRLVLMMAERREPPETNGGGVWIPMVEGERLTDQQRPIFARIRQVRLSLVLGRDDSGGDELYLDRLEEPGSGNAAGVLPSLDAARDVIREIARVAIPKPMRVFASFADVDALAGESLCAGLAAELVCRLLHEVGHRDEFWFNQNVAVTGQIDEQGRLLPVDEDGLRCKVEACVFSWIRYLVVPKEQEKFCLESMAGVLQGGQAGSPLHIVGLSSLSDIFANRRLIASRRNPLVRHIGRKVWAARMPLAIGIVLALSLVIARLTLGPMDRNPAVLRWKGETLIVENANGNTIDRVDVGRNTVFHATNLSGEFQTRDAALVDVDDDGINEVLYARIPGEGEDEPSEVICWSVNQQKELWRRGIKVGFTFPRHPSADSTVYRVTHVSAGDFDRDRNADVVLSANGGSFAALLMRLDGRTGEVTGTYLHIGHLYAMQPFDLDGDGIVEVVASGINNAYDQACIVILDPSKVSGHGPTMNVYEVEGLPSAEHEAYVLVPRTIVGDVFRYLQRSNMGVSLLFRGEGRREMMVGINDVVGLDRSFFEQTTARYYLTFDSLLNPLTMNTGDDYDLVSRKLVERHKIPFLPKDNPAYFKKYLRTLRYWHSNAWMRRGE